MFLFVINIFGGPEPFAPLRAPNTGYYENRVQVWVMYRGCHRLLNGYLFWGRVVALRTLNFHI
jgi:hypothetical protein